MTKNEYDLIVIGAGGAGSSAAGNSAGSGKRVALIERDKLGGTCLNYGCDPTKTLLHTASVLYHAQHATELGLRIPQAKADWEAVLARAAGAIVVQVPVNCYFHRGRLKTSYYIWKGMKRKSGN